MREKSEKPSLDECLVSGEHSELCKQKNGIKPTNFSSRNKTTEAKIKDVSEEFKKRLVELATEKIWLAPMKIWNIARNKIVSAGNDVALSFPNSDVVRTEKKLGETSFMLLCMFGFIILSSTFSLCASMIFNVHVIRYVSFWVMYINCYVYNIMNSTTVFSDIY